MRALPTILLTTLMGFSAALAAQTRDENWKRCAGGEPDLGIGGCTLVIQSGQETDNNLVIAFTNRGNYYRDKGEDDRAIQDYDQAIKLNPNNSDSFLGRGNVYFHKKEYDRAIQEYDQAIKLNSNSVFAFNARGQAYAGKGDYDQALQDYDQAIKLDPGYSAAFNNRGNAYSNLGKYDLALKDFDQLLKLVPDSAFGFNNRGNAYLRMGQYQRSIPEFNQAIKLKPNYLNAFRGRAAAYFYLGQFDEAEPDFATALKSTPTDGYSALWLYVTQSRAGKNARATLEQDAGQIDRTAWPGPLVDFFLGKTTSAAVLALAADPSPHEDKSHHCEAYFYLAEDALKQGRRSEAKRLLQQSIDTNAIWELQYAASKEQLKRLRPAQAAQAH